MAMTVPEDTRTRPILCLLFLLCGLFLPAMIPAARAGDDFHFITISDIPYSAKENYVLTQSLAPAIIKDDAPFVVHMGDFKNSSISCTAALMTERRNQIVALHPGRVFYTPGDNDWADCDREEIPERFSKLNRLDLLRRLFYSTSMNLPPEWQFARQNLYPENMRWTYKNVVFATVHMVSTNNGRLEILLDDPTLALDLIDARDQADLRWLYHSFGAAVQQNARAIVIATQADVTRIKFTPPCSVTLRQKCDAFTFFRRAIALLAKEFKKPVLLVHGDTHPYCLDKTFGGKEAPNLWRFNSTGDYSFVDAVRVTVDPENKAAPFAFLSLMRHLPPRSTCKAG
ncbi:MAG: hypothetical protein EP348_00440 [Alphaproteobacteria bacterium]|nr:MAG: hypothetical protein EP348_00440 [Alphaproteobacteria bacterium]